jgi:hypothetical protein
LSQTWVSLYSFTPEMFGNTGNSMIGFVNGKPHLHDSSSVYNNFYGQQSHSYIKTMTSNMAETIWNTVSMEGTDLWFVESAKTPSGQETDMLDGTLKPIGGKTTRGDFVQRGSMFYTSILRDKNTNPDKLNGKPALKYGDPLKGRSLELRLKNSSKDLATIDFVNVGFDLEPGHHVT